ncbi:MAG: DUF5672 family protein [Bacteroidales bacterium]
MDKKCIIVIPIYKEIPDNFEIIAINRCFKILFKYSIVFVCSKHLNREFYIDRYPSAKFEFFEKYFFSNIAGYNCLVTSFTFYDRFSAYEYMLIYQPDCYVFDDRLDYYCSLNYDYIGAPWIPSKNKAINKLISSFKSRCAHLLNKIASTDKRFKVGNGGLSLRKITTFKEVTLSYNEFINDFLSKDGDLYNEDIFFSIQLSKLGYSINIPNFVIACGFAIESSPQKAIEFNNGRLPLGCHAWSKMPFIKFWQQYIKELNLKI